MWELNLKEGWNPKNKSFQIMVLEKALASPLDCKIKPVNHKGNQSWILTGRTNLKLQDFGYMMQRANSLEKTLRLGKIEGRRRRGPQRMRRLDAITDSIGVWASSRCWWWTEKPGVLQSMGSQRVRHDWATELNWIFTKTAGLQIIPAFKQFLGLSNKK